ncbi:MAG TPA: uroporphyrinogen-III C-methyltransferase, partial [Thermoleophilia bacterium]|nr:uroporphyrinogen-III C-methyltransferase [Thermoleophilia bacterium]
NAAAWREPRVFLVGAGPGDPGLITIRGLRLLERAEVVLYDRLVDPMLLDAAPPSAEMIYVGKRTAAHTVPQDDINRLLLAHGRRGRRVVRLKGGDPFIFGRGGEEAMTLHEAGIPFEVVPGISAGYSVPAYAGIPVTYRGLTSHVTFVTGHEDPTKDSAALDWDKLASGVGTLVIFMGVKNLPQVVQKLKERGRPGDTPAALIQQGTLPGQRTVVGCLDDIVDKVKESGLRPPAITVIGDVVSLREQLAWVEQRPLFGRRVVVTRARAQAQGQIDRLRDLGAEVIAFPTIRIEPVERSREISAMLEGLGRYQYVIFTSANAVACFFERLGEAGLDVRRLHQATVVAVGPKTAAACRAGGLQPDLIPEDFVGEGILEVLGDSEVKGAWVLIPRARKARDLLPRTLSAAGAVVEVVPLYDTLPTEPEEGAVRRVLEADYVTFTSSSTVKNFADLFRAQGLEERLGEIRAASIGPMTSETVRKEGLQLIVEAREHTVEGLVQALAARGGDSPR